MRTVTEIAELFILQREVSDSDELELEISFEEAKLLHKHWHENWNRGKFPIPFGDTAIGMGVPHFYETKFIMRVYADSQHHPPWVTIGFVHARK